MLRRAKAGYDNTDVENKGKLKKKDRRRIAFEDHSPLTPLEAFIYVCSFLFVAVFSAMQGIFLYKLHIYEAALATAASTTAVNTAGAGERPSRALVTTDQISLSNHDRIELMTNSTRRPFKPWPPIEAIVEKSNNTIIGDPQFLLDIALLGFEKCGTDFTFVLLMIVKSAADIFYFC